jgi:uncharacterized protein (DUF4415 family)
MKDRGELLQYSEAPTFAVDLDISDWEVAVETRPAKQSVHLKIDQEVLEWFRQSTGGKGHITRMQAVLKSYVNAQKAAAEQRLTKG